MEETVEKIEKLEKRIRELEKDKDRRNRKKKQDLIGKVVAGSIGAVGYTYFLGTPIRKTGEFVGETIDGIRLVSKMLSPNFKREIDDKYLEMINPEIKNEYVKNKENGGIFGKIENALNTAIETGARASEKFPGINTKPAKYLIDLKSNIIKRTKSLIPRIDNEDVEIQGTEQYQKNYDDLSKIKYSGKNKNKKIGIESLSAKINNEINESSRNTASK